MSIFKSLFGKRQDVEASAHDYYLKGLELGAKGATTKSIAAFKKAVQLNPSHAQAHRDLAVGYCAVDLDSARKHYEILKKLDPDLADRLAKDGVFGVILGFSPKK